ncbi:MAG: hypothetical protein GY863_15915, partial [bacterium]|nr:hypothetical protein [bacterium]
FIWFATFDGLCRYDGYDVIRYKHDPDDLNSLSSDSVMCLIEGKNGLFWIGSTNGIDSFDPATEKVTHYICMDNTNPDSLQLGMIVEICEDRYGNIWGGTRTGGLAKLAPKTGQFSFYKYASDDPSSIRTDYISSIFEDRSGNLWIGTGYNCLNLFDRNTDSFRRFTYSVHPDSTMIYYGSINSIMEDSEGKLWMLSVSGLTEFNRETEQFQSHILDNPKAYNGINDERIDQGYIYPAGICDDKEHGIIWISSQAGLFQYNKSEEYYIYFQNSFNNPKSLTYNETTSLLLDKSGVLWVGTAGYGINTYTPISKRFNKYSFDSRASNRITVRSIRSIITTVDGRFLWIGGYSGANKINRETGEIISHFPAPIYSMCIDPDDPENIMWLGLDGSGLIKASLSGKPDRNFLLDPDDPILAGTIYAQIVDRDGYLWFGADNGLYKLNRKTEKAIRYTNIPNDQYSLSENCVRTILINDKNELWIGTDNGMNKLDPETERFTRFMHDPNDSMSISSGAILSITKGREGIFWIGTSGGGLNKFDPKTEQFSHYTTNDGLLDNTVYAALEDNDGNLWLSSNKGITKFNPETGNVQNYRKNDGLQDDEFNAAAYYKSNSGEMFFGGINGLNAFYPENIKDNETIPPIAITKLEIANKAVPVGKVTDSRTILDKVISSAEEIELTHKDHMFSLEFAALDYIASDKNEYAYMLDGLEDDWIFVKNRRYVTYTSLPAGDYTFKVKGSNNDGIWNEEGASLKIRIKPPYWKTTWFISINIILALGTAVLLVYWRFTFLKKRNILLQEKVEERTTELRTKSEELEVKVLELENSIDRVNKLEGLLPICSACKRIRLKETESKKQENWIQIEKYISDRTDADFSHGICPECIKELYPDIYKKGSS